MTKPSFRIQDLPWDDHMHVVVGSVFDDDEHMPRLGAFADYNGAHEDYLSFRLVRDTTEEP